MPEVFTRNQLKAAAMAAMLCDHVAVVLIRGELYLPLRIVGRIAFPIFAYFIVQGFLHTSDYRKYFMRIGIFALVSEIPFDLAFEGKVLEFHSQNVMFTLLIALGMLYFLREWEGNAWVRCLVFLAGCLLGGLLRVDYGWFGVAVVGFFYLLRFLPKGYQFLFLGLLFCSYGGIECFGMIGVLCVLLYREDRETFLLPKYLFYAFYPLHLFILWWIRWAAIPL